VVPQPVTLLGYEEEKPLRREVAPKALVFLIVEIIEPFEEISQPLGRKEGSMSRPVIAPCPRPPLGDFPAIESPCPSPLSADVERRLP
jgi:hypothetical protein